MTFKIYNDVGNIRAKNPSNYDFSFIQSKIEQEILFATRFVKPVIIKQTDLPYEINRGGVYKIDSNIYQSGNNYKSLISIKSDNVLLDLNGCSIQQTPEGNLTDRLVTLVECSGHKHIKIINGVLGLTSCYALRINNCKYVELKNVEMVNYEIAAMLITNCQFFVIHDININQNNQAVIVNSKYLQSQKAIEHASLILNKNPDAILQKNNQTLTGSNLLQTLKTCLDKNDSVNLDDWLKTVKSEDILDFYASKDEVVYGIVVKNCNFVYLLNVNITSIKCSPVEVPNWFDIKDSKEKVFVDSSGFVVDFFTQVSSMESTLYPKYIGTPLSDLQLFNVTNSTKGYLSDDIKKWVASETTNPSILSKIKNIPNKDFLSRSNQTCSALLLDISSDIIVKNLVIDSVKNKSIFSSDLANVSGIHINHCNHIFLSRTVIGNIISNKGKASAITLSGKGTIIFEKLYHMGFGSKKENVNITPLNKENFSGFFYKK
eukprot:Pgem_evm4s19777